MWWCSSVNKKYFSWIVMIVGEKVRVTIYYFVICVCISNCLCQEVWQCQGNFKTSQRSKTVPWPQCCPVRKAVWFPSSKEAGYFWLLRSKILSFQIESFWSCKRFSVVILHVKIEQAKKTQSPKPCWHFLTLLLWPAVSKVWWAVVYSEFASWVSLQCHCLLSICFGFYFIFPCHFNDSKWEVNKRSRLL